MSSDSLPSTESLAFKNKTHDEVIQFIIKKCGKELLCWKSLEHMCDLHNELVKSNKYVESDACPGDDNHRIYSFIFSCINHKLRRFFGIKNAEDNGYDHSCSDEESENERSQKKEHRDYCDSKITGELIDSLIKKIETEDVTSEKKKKSKTGEKKSK